MPRFHAGFSIGTVAGALLGAAMVALHVPVTAHLHRRRRRRSAIIVPLAVRGFLPDDRPHRREHDGGAGAAARRARPGASRAPC